MIYNFWKHGVCIYPDEIDNFDFGNAEAVEVWVIDQNAAKSIDSKDLIDWVNSDQAIRKLHSTIPVSVLKEVRDIYKDKWDENATFFLAESYPSAVNILCEYYVIKETLKYTKRIDLPHKQYDNVIKVCATEDLG